MEKHYQPLTTMKPKGKEMAMMYHHLLQKRESLDGEPLSEEEGEVSEEEATEELKLKLEKQSSK
ncbi:22K [Odocoileus adenovirus 1]|uniref:22K n=2 Tax=Deer atadenovirus A TaxID=2169706 RepID=A0A515MFS6_9ADEN|nr:22K [Odocoileus adenovirus 1]QDM55327.1 22K [Deer atadenovirus A]ASU50481.1 22K [Odocoileus adenovirus 1]ASU50508.1 22K [Odocoileus adenovirus 1]ASU50535.1 22K [Odocoileus adenovirus 1]ASU50562.1 22K [Odocoileus adenovirus 1]